MYSAHIKGLKKSNLWLFGEYVLIFFGVPLALFYTRNVLMPSIILLPVLVVVFFMLYRINTFTWHELIRWQISKSSLRFNALIILAACLILFLAVLIFTPDKLFNLPRNNIKVWLSICVYYPILSAYSQEIVFRTFLFRRYKQLFTKPMYFILASGICFGFAHILYFSFVSVGLSMLLGFYLSSIYLKTKSVLFTTLIHSILGIFVFSIGLGEYFWLEMVKYF